MKSFYSLNKKVVMVSTLSLLLLGTISCGSEKARPSNNNNDNPSDIPSDILSETTLASPDMVILSRTLLTNETQNNPYLQNIPNRSILDRYVLQDGTIESVLVPSDTVITNDNVDEVFASGLQIEARSILDNENSYATPYGQNYQNYQNPTQRIPSRPSMNPNVVNPRFDNNYTRGNAFNARTMMLTSQRSTHQNSFVSNHSSRMGSSAMQQQFSANFNIDNNFNPMMPPMAPNVGYNHYSQNSTIANHSSHMGGSSNYMQNQSHESFNYNQGVPYGYNTTSPYVGYNEGISSSSSIEDILNSDTEECALESGCFGFARLNDISSLTYRRFTSVEEFANTFWGNTGFNYKLYGSSSVDKIALPTDTYYSETGYSYAVFSAVNN